MERLHKTMRAEFFTRVDGLFATIEDLREALDKWVVEYNSARPHPSCGGRPPAERFALADRSITADITGAGPAAAAAPAHVPARAPAGRVAGVSRWVNAHGKISLAGFSYAVGATYAGEPVEVVVAGGLVEILHAGVVVATHAERLREDQARPRAAIDAAIAGASVQLSKDGKVIRVTPSITTAHASSARSPAQRPPPPQELRHRQRRLGAGTPMSPRYRNSTP